MPKTQADLLLDVASGTGPLHERLASALRTAIRERRIAVGDLLPPSRALAADLGCSRWAVTEAYGQLVAEGFLESRTGSGTRVRWASDDPRPQRGTREPAPEPRYDLAPGLPDLRAFPRRAWADAVRGQVASVAFAEFGYPLPGGHPRLRELLAVYLLRSRGARVAPADLTVGTGVTDGVRRLCTALRAEGITAVGCEEPGWTRLRDVVRDAGLEVVPVRIDEHGVRVEELDGLRAVLVTPAHQFPHGTVLSPERRAALLRWAHRVDGVVVEDDYDAEFRYDRRPVGTVQGLDPARVVLLASLSKTVSPALGIGWMATPPRWTRLLPAGTPPPVLDQLAFAALLESGGYDRHLRRARLRYRRRRDALVAALGRHLPGLPVAGIAAGLHLVLPLPAAIDSAAVVAAAGARALRVADLRGYHAVRAGAGNGLVLGYGNLADAAVDDAVQVLRAAIVTARSA